MRFLIDENLPLSLKEVFLELGFDVEHVVELSTLRGKADEVIFNYAKKNGAVVVTKDLNFANPLRFDLRLLKGLIIIRFPNEITTITLCREIKRLVKDFSKKDFCNLLVIEPGLVRIRSLR